MTEISYVSHNVTVIPYHTPLNLQKHITFTLCRVSLFVYQAKKEEATRACKEAVTMNTNSIETIYYFLLFVLTPCFFLKEKKKKTKCIKNS